MKKRPVQDFTGLASLHKASAECGVGVEKIVEMVNAGVLTAYRLPYAAYEHVMLKDAKVAIEDERRSADLVEQGKKRVAAREAAARMNRKELEAKLEKMRIAAWARVGIDARASPFNFVIHVMVDNRERDELGEIHEE